MAKAEYRYNPKTLTYEKAELGIKGRLLKFLGYIGTGMVFSIVFLAIFYALFDSPKEKKLIRKNEHLALQLDLFDKKLNQMESVLDNLQDRDDNVYRVVFEADPIPANIRKAGFGGVNRYGDLEGYDHSESVIKTAKKLDQLAKQMYIQSKSLDEVYNMAMKKEKMLSSIPAIMPVAKKNLKRVASGFGMRIHPILKIRKMHPGMDFTAPTGTPIYSSGDGVVEKVKTARGGYGKHIVINHGYGYQTLYAHMNEYNVKRGQKVNRGDVIGYVGNTGRSTGPHLHYEVIKDGVKINPVNFYSNDLTPEEYELMIEISSQTNQSFD